MVNKDIIPLRYELVVSWYFGMEEDVALWDFIKHSSGIVGALRVLCFGLNQRTDRMRGFSLSEYTTVQPPLSSSLLEYSAPVPQLRIITHASDIGEPALIPPVYAPRALADPFLITVPRASLPERLHPMTNTLVLVSALDAATPIKSQW